MLSFNVIVTALLVMCIVLSYFQWIYVKRAHDDMLTIDKMSRKTFIWMMLEIFINLIHPMPFLVNTTFEEKVYILNINIEKRIDTILFSFMLTFRVYHFLRPIFLSSYFMNNRAFRVCRINGINCSYLFSIRGLFSVYSIPFTVLAYVATNLFFGVLFRFNEGSAHRINPAVQNFNWRNSFW